MQSQPSPVYWFFGDLDDDIRGRGRGLYEAHRAFRSQIEHCEQALAGRWPRSLKSILWEEEAHTAVSDAFVAAFCLQIATARLWLSWGVSPSLVVGDRSGEFAAACVTGVFSLEDAVYSAANYLVYRGGRENLSKALWHYNQDNRYVSRVMRYLRYQ